MALSEETLRQLRKAFSDICKGYSIAFFNKKRLYLKHLSHHEQVDMEVLYKRFYDHAISRRVPTEKESLENHKEEWGEKDEKEIEEMRTSIIRMTEGKKVIILQSELENQQALINKKEEELIEKQMKKRALAGYTAEVYAERKLNEAYIVESFFLDDKLSNKYFNDVELDEISSEDMQAIIAVYNAEMEYTSDKNVKLLCIQDFFQAYWSFTGDDFSSFFGKAICNFSYSQLKLASYGRVFRNALSKADTIPEDIKSDPDRLLDYVRAGENAKEIMDNGNASNNDVVASTMFGAKEKDYQGAGVESDGVNLMDALKKSKEKGNDSIDMHELMKMMGV